MKIFLQFTLSLFLIIGTSSTTFCQLDNLWVNSIGEEQTTALISKMAEDSQGNLIVTGNFSGSVVHFSENVFAQGIGMTDIFIAKYNKNGEAVWAETFGGIDRDMVHTLALTPNDEILIGGYFIGEEGEKPKGGWPFNSFVAKYSSSGSKIWQTSSTKGVTRNSINSIDVNSEGEIIVGGIFYDKIAFDNTTLNSSTDQQSVFICKYNSNGTLISANYDDNINEIIKIKSLDDNSLMVTGAVLNNRQVSERYWNTIALKKYNADLSTNWIYLNDTINQPIGSVLDSDGNIISISNLYEPWGASLCATDYKPENYFNITKCDKNGNLVWSKNWIGAWVNSINLNSNNSILIAGEQFKNEITIGNSTLIRNADSSHACAYYPDMFLAQFASNGNGQWAQNITGGLDDKAYEILPSKNGDYFLNASFESYLVQIGNDEIINNSVLGTFTHVSGTYFDRTPLTLLSKVCFNGCQSDNTDNVNENPISIYPNPANNQLYIQQRNFLSVQPISVTFNNLLGQPVLKKNLTSETTPVDISTLSKGIYLVNITNGTEHWVHRIVVE